MTYQERVQEAQNQIEKIIAAGAPIVKLNIFDVINSYTPSEKIKNQIDYTKELYLELIEKLRENSEEEQLAFLKLLKDVDVIDNQSIEKEDSFSIALHQKFERVFSVDLLLAKLCNNEKLTKKEFVDFHDVLLVGTSSYNKTGLRDNDLKFVGSYQQNPETKYHFENRAISYFPIKHEQIEEAINKFLTFINNKIEFNNEYDMVLLPMICHGLIAALQLFKDGNTRYGRLFQSVLLFKLTNENLNLNLPLPIVYASKQYESYRDLGRKKVENIVLNNDVQSWEEWFIYNLKRIQDGIFYNLYCLENFKIYKRR